MSINSSDLDLMDEEELSDAFDNPGRQSDEGSSDDSPQDKETDAPTGDEDEPEKESDADSETRFIELEFENEALKEQLGSLQKAAEFLDEMAKASSPQEAVAAFAKHVGATGVQGSPKGDWSFADSYDEESKETIVSVRNAVNGELAPLQTRIAQLEAKLSSIEPHVAKTREQEESAKRASDAEKRAGGVANLVVQMSPGRNAGWTPTREQVIEVAKANPDLFKGAGNAKEAAKALLEKVRVAHLDDIIGHKNGKKRPAGDNRSPVPKNDARGADSEYDSRKAAIIQKARSGF
jgi:hypothetical protein